MGEEIEVWGRQWIVKDSSLGPQCGKGVFSLEDIIVPHPLPRGYDGVHLFPYAGAVYTRKNWRIIMAQHPSWSKYQLDMDTDADEVLKRPYHTRVIDGDPVCSSNLAGYINSTLGCRPERDPNVWWIQVGGPPQGHGCRKHMDDHIVTVAKKTIRAGEELLCAYEY